MVKTSILWREDGSVPEMTNLSPTADGGVRVTEATMNAVITQFLGYDYDEDGNRTEIWATSVMCKDDEFRDVLLDRARKMVAG